MFKPSLKTSSLLAHLGFNLLGEILFVQATATTEAWRSLSQFQSLGRDSVCSSFHRLSPPLFSLYVSISWARFCLFKLYYAPPPLQIQPVSISWARFCLFKPAWQAICAGQGASFNLLGEILFVQAGRQRISESGRFRFQSLGRDSVCSSPAWQPTRSSSLFVSISWARFCLFKHEYDLALSSDNFEFQSLGRDSVCSSYPTSVPMPETTTVSISWARFCLFKLRALALSTYIMCSFNLLGEILFVQARWQHMKDRGDAPFQSLGRDSVCSSIGLTAADLVKLRVSISWARFCLFKLAPTPPPTPGQTSFNLLGEILFVQA